MCGRYYNFISKDEMSHYKNYEIVDKYKNFSEEELKAVVFKIISDGYK